VRLLPLEVLSSEYDHHVQGMDHVDSLPAPTARLGDSDGIPCHFGRQDPPLISVTTATTL
jgi:hypothetical protein